jgi:hypothetical protein
MRNRILTMGGLLGGLVLSVLVAASVAAYSGQVAGTVEVSGPSGAQPCNTPITVTSTVLETASGDPIEGQPVEWSFVSGNVAGDTILDTTTTTNADGVATTQVRFACSPHSVTIQAVADDVMGTAVLNTSGDALPRTDTVSGSSLPGILLAALAVLIGSATILRRFATDRR